MNISIVIPTLDNPDDVANVIESLNLQSLLPSEIVIVDSSSNNEINELINTIPSQVPLTYKRLGRAYSFDRLFLFLDKLPIVQYFLPTLEQGRAYPYEATNQGALIAKHQWLALLDATTIPNRFWVQDYCQIIEQGDVEVVLGNTQYLASTFFQKVLRASTYGANGIETSPGSFIKKEDYLNGFQITEGVRSGGDVDWKNRVKKNFKSSTPEEPYLVYPNLPKSLFPCAKKFFIYSIYTAVQDISHSIKDLYLIATLIFTLVLIPKWNSIVGSGQLDWESSPYYIPHITKIWFISISLTLLFSIVYNRLVLSKSSKPLFRNVHKLTILVLISFIIYNWNSFFADWVEESVWYFPHITKIYVSIICLASFMYRGIYFPIKNNISLSFLFPMNWFLVGCVGFILDIVKAPGYLLGTIFSPFFKTSRRSSARI